MTSLSVGLDAFNIALKRGFGIATYARNLNTALRGLGMQTHLLYGPERGLPRDPLLAEINLFDAPRPSSDFPLWGAMGQQWRIARAPFGRSARRIPISGEVITDQVARHAPQADAVWAAHDLFHTANRAHSAFGRFTPLRFEDGAGGGPDVMHWTCPLPLHAPGRPNIYTLHDMVPLRLPFTTLDNKRRYLRLCRQICERAEHIATVSEHSKRDLVRILGVPESQVTVTYQAVSLPAPLLQADDAEAIVQIESMFGLGWRDYFVFFGAIEPKKNLARVIEAYLSAGADSPLVIVGGKGWLEDEETRLLYPDLIRVQTMHEGALRQGQRVRLYEYLPFDLLAKLIKGAKATLAPFLYEGFGLPVLESMQLGAPVMAANSGSLPEVTGDAALLVDPYDVAAMRQAIRALDADADLRADLSRRGRRQAQTYSPEAYQARLKPLYEPYA